MRFLRRDPKTGVQIKVGLEGYTITKKSWEPEYSIDQPQGKPMNVAFFDFLGKITHGSSFHDENVAIFTRLS